MATVLYFVPHQDDDVLIMGVSIAQHVAEGYDVKVILCTDGQSSSIRTKLNDKSSCPNNFLKTHDIHNIELTPGANGTFTSCRDCEFRCAMLALGVELHNIIIPHTRVVDGYANKNFSDAVMQFENIVSQYIVDPSFAIRSISPYTNGQHNDHKALGQAVINVCNRVRIMDRRAYIEPWLISNYAGPEIPWRESVEKNSLIGDKIITACSEYGTWAPKIEKYAIGFHSVYQIFLEAMGQTIKHDGKPTNYAHG